jgi:serine phosphatase RsbU (regulator of sigma subunit)/pSer/pThr/pTyr-binding forkhead associated (FHA) protein
LAYELIVINPNGHQSRVPLERFPFSIGRHSENQLILRDSRVSRKHAQLQINNGQLSIEDLESLHGVRVNGEKVAVAALREGDEIDFGLEDGYRLILSERDEQEIRKLLTRLPGNEGAKSNELARLRALTEVARSIEHSLSITDVLATVIEGALTVTGMERGFLLLDKEGELRFELGRDHSSRKLTAADLPVPTELIRRALSERKDLLSLQFDPLADWSGRFNDSLVGLDLRTVLCVPIIRLRGRAEAGETMAASIEDTIGVLYMDSRSSSVATEAGSRELLQTLALEASSILENARLLDEERQRQRLEKELELARTIQESLLPRQLPTGGGIEAVGSSIPTHQVGGDFYDVLPRPDGGYLATVADVSGKGVAAALLASLLQGVLMEAAAAGTPLEVWLPRLNHFLLERTGGEKYCTIFACEVNCNGHVRFVNAGHSRPFVVKPGGAAGPEIKVLDSSGFPVGMLPQATYPVEEFHLAAGECLVIFSDGVEEATRGPKEFFGRRRIASALAAHAGKGAQGMHAGLREALREFLGKVDPHDDATILLLRRS